MQSYLTDARVLLARCHVVGLFVIPALCFLLFTARAGGSEPTNAGGTASGASAANGDNVVADSSGPTVMLDYVNETFEKNPISSFMYFVPLLSRTHVDRQTSANNEEEVDVISYCQEIGAKYFYVACEFEIRGKGFHQNVFDPEGMIAARTRELNDNEPMTHILDYIKFEGEGFGRIEVAGTINGSTEIVTQVNVQFNVRGQKSPVTIGLYDIAPKDGEYKYENRSNELVARVNTLAFTRSDETPRMGVGVASIAKGAAPDGFFASIKGAMTNLLLTPSKIDTLGNETMLDFGYAILKQKPESTFPLAKNIE